MKEKEARELLTELFERHSVPSIQIKFFQKPITEKVEIHDKLKDLGLSHLEEATTVRETTKATFNKNQTTGEVWIEFYGFPSKTTIIEMFKDYLEHMGKRYIRERKTRA